MTDLIKQLAPHYRQNFVMTESVESDIKLIKKINMLFGKLEKTKRDVYVLEIINVIKIINNVLYLDKIILVIYNCVDTKYHSTLDYIIDKVLSE